MAILQALSLCALLLANGAVAEKRNQMVKLLMVDYSVVEGKPHTRLVKVQGREMNIDFESSPRKYTRQDGQDFIHIYYKMGEGTFHTQSLQDPRIIQGDWMRDGERTGQALIRTRATFSVYVPQHATELQVVARGPKKGKAYLQSQETGAGLEAGSLIVTDTEHISTLTIPKQMLWDSRTVLPQAQPTNAEVLPEASDVKGDPEALKNLVFMSGGFTDSDSDKSRFITICLHSLEFLRGASDSSVMSAPWDRYISVINFISVWQPSPQAGASFPSGSAGGKPGVGVVTVDDNLGCSYGTDTLRLLSCDYTKTLELASISGADMSRTTSIVFVNEEEYGGSGGSRVGAVYAGKWEECTPCGPALSNNCQCAEVKLNGKSYGWKPASDNKFLKVLIHELGHADAGLGDEYDYKRSDSKEPTNIANCDTSSDGAKWKHWVGKSNGVDSPVATCGFTNWNKPTDGLCLMNTERANEYCAVCSENVIKKIYEETDQFAVPRCPREHETIVITDKDEVHYLVAGKVSGGFLGGGITDERDPVTLEASAHKDKSGNPRARSDGTVPLRVDKGDIAHTWIPQSPGLNRESGNRNNVRNTYAINGRTLGARDEPHIVEFSVEDKTNFIADPALANARTRVARFRIKVVPESDPNYRHCTVASLSGATAGSNSVNECPVVSSTANRLYCGICDAGKVCNETFPSRPFQVEANLDASLDRLEGTLFGIGGAIIVCGFIGLIAIILIAAYCSSNGAHEIVPLPKPLKYARIGMIVFSFITMLAAVVMIIVCAFSYRNLTAIGRSLVLVLMVLACVLFLLAFLGLVAAYFRSRVLLTINGILLILVVLTLLGVAIAVLYYGDNPDSQTVKDYVKNEWEDQIKSNPKSMCSFQTTFKCSGLDAACHNKDHSQCPPDCEITNRNSPNPCFSKAQEQVAEYYVPVGAICVALCVLMLIGLILNWALCCCIRDRKKALKQRKMKQQKQAWSEGVGPQGGGKTPGQIPQGLKDSEMSKLRHEWKRVAPKGPSGAPDGKGTAEELRKFFNKALGQDIKKNEARDMVAGKEDRDGRVDFEEFLSFYGNNEVDKQARDQAVSDPQIRHLDRTEAEQLYKEFSRLDHRKVGSITDTQLKLFYRRLYHAEANETNLRDALRAVENTNPDAITFPQFAQMFAGKIEAKPN